MTVSKRNILSFLFLVAGCMLLKKYEIASVYGFPDSASEASNKTPSNKESDSGSRTKSSNTNETPKSRTKRVYYNHTDIDALGKFCDKAKDCQASKMYRIVCGSDGEMYRNIGVLTCAQKCNMNLKIKNIGPCEDAVPVTKNTKALVLVSKSGNETQGNQEISFNDTQAPLTDEMRIALKQRIRERTSHYEFPPFVQDYCKNQNHTKRCRYGFDPRKNVSWYLLPGRQFNWGGELGKWGDGRKQHKMFHKYMK